jgi:uncharacterized protein
MMRKKAYVIQFGGLKVGSHSFEMEVNDEFFEDLDYSEISKASVKAEIEVLKQNNVLTLHFHLTGTVETICDRCGIESGLPIDITEKLVVKHGEPKESTEDIVVLPHGETEVDVSHFLYEFITIAVPPKRIPCEEDDTIECDYDALAKLDSIGTEEEREDSSEDINPIWKDLKKLKFKDN